VPTESCEVAANCSPYATCTFNEELKTHYCKCLPGFEGDGYNCIRPTCVLGVCWCPNGYQYIDNKCERTVISDEVNQGKILIQLINLNHNDNFIHFFLCPLVSCNEVNICNPNAQCVLLAISTKPQPEYTCQCNAGFSGDGFQCAELIGSITPPLILPSPIESMGETSSCDVKDNCGPQATCVYDDEALKSVCVCNDGYRGDGFLCTPMGKVIFRPIHNSISNLLFNIFPTVTQMDVTVWPIVTQMHNVCSVGGSSGTSVNAIRATLEMAATATNLKKV